MVWNGTKPYPYFLTSSHWGHRNFGNDNMADGQQNRELEGKWEGV
jgi:hypothetical protein